jgi:hypothetical protein
MTEQNIYDKNALYKDMNKYFLANYAMQKIEEGSPEGEIAGKAHLTKNCSLEGLLDITGLDKTPMEAIQVHASVYASKMNQLKVEDALAYFKAPKEIKENLIKYSGKTVEDLFKGFKKGKEAEKKYKEAKTEGEALEAFKEKNQYKDISKDYASISLLSSYLCAEKAAPAIADYQRKQLAKQYAKPKK